MSERYSSNPKMFKSNPLGFIISIILIPVGIGIIILLWWYLDTKRTKLKVTDTQVMYEKGILSKERSEISIDSIRTVKVKQSFINRIFGVGTIELYTAGDTPEIIASGMPDPNEFRDIIR